MSKILILNDDTDASNDLIDALKCDHEVVAVTDSQAAIGVLSQGFALLITDVLRPADEETALGSDYNAQVIQAATKAGVRVAICSCLPDGGASLGLPVLSTSLDPIHIRQQVNYWLDLPVEKSDQEEPHEAE